MKKYFKVYYEAEEKDQELVDLYTGNKLKILISIDPGIHSGFAIFFSLDDGDWILFSCGTLNCGDDVKIKHYRIAEFYNYWFTTNQYTKGNYTLCIEDQFKGSNFKTVKSLIENKTLWVGSFLEMFDDTLPNSDWQCSVETIYPTSWQTILDKEVKTTHERAIDFANKKYKSLALGKRDHDVACAICMGVCQMEKTQLGIC